MRPLGEEGNTVVLDTRAQRELVAAANTREDFTMTLASTPRVTMLASLAAAALASGNALATIGPTGDADIYAIAIDPTAPWILYVGATQGIFKTTDGGQTWSPSGEGITGQIYSNMVVDPTDPQKVYLGTNGYGLYRSTDGGASWSHGEGSYHQTVKSIAIDPDQANVLSMGAFRDIYRSFDYGANWGPLHLFDFATGVLSIAHDSVSTNTMYIGTNTHGLMKSTDRGYNWDFTSAGQITTVVAIDPSDHNVVFGSGFTALMKSTNAGATWRTVLPVEYGSAVVFDTVNLGAVYASFSYDGVYVSGDDGESWSSANVGLPTVQINTLAIDSADGIVYAGTEGYGIYVSYDGGQTWN